MKIAGICLLLILVAGVGEALAQNNLGELLDKGGKKVLKAEYEAALPLTIKGPTTNGTAYLEFHKGGTLSGEFTLPQGGKSRIQGTWTMDPSGKQCIYERFEAWGNNWTDCDRYVFQLNGRFFRARSDTDRSSSLLVHEPKR